MDGQTEVVNRSLGNLLRSRVDKNILERDFALAKAEFAYNSSTSQTIGASLFEVIYERNPINPLDFVPLHITHHFSGDREDNAKHIKKLHEQIWVHIEKQNQ